MDNVQSIRDKILFLIKASNLSTNKMLMALNLNTSLLNDMRKGVLPSADKLAKIAEYFNVSVDYLLGTEYLKSNPHDNVSHLYLLGSDGTKNYIIIPNDKVERVKQLLEAGFPELFTKN